MPNLLETLTQLFIKPLYDIFNPGTGHPTTNPKWEIGAMPNDPDKVSQELYRLYSNDNFLDLNKISNNPVQATDLNSIVPTNKTTAFWFNAVAVNIPTTDLGKGIQIVESSTAKTQMVSTETNNRLFIRTQIGGIWGSWTEFANKLGDNAQTFKAANGAASDDVVTKNQLDTKAELGGLNTQTFKSSAGVASDDVVTKAQLDTKAALGGSNAQTFKAAPGSASDDVPTKAQLDQIYSEQIGVIRTTAKISASSGWLFCNGSSILKTTYASLYALLTQSQGTVTMTIAAPCLVSLAAHGFDTGHSIFINTTGTLPTGLSQDVNYYVVKNNADSFWLATSRLNAIAGTKITTTGSQSGVHSLTFAPWGINGANSFYIPDFRGITLIGNGWNSLADMLEASGDQYHGFLGVYRQDQMQGHIHNGSSSAPAGGSGTTVWYSGGSTFNVSTPASDGVHGIPRTGDYTTGPFVGVNYEIKY